MAQSIIAPKQNSPQLVKAKLIAYKGEAPDIELMFNPTEISLARSVKWESKAGSRSSTLLPKSNFSGVEPYKLTLKQLLFDTYETKESVMIAHINDIKKGVTTIEESNKDSKIADAKHDKRPPVYVFYWGQDYFHCVMTSLSYTLTMFLTDGTPVRAMVDIALQEVDEKNFSQGKKPAPTGKNRGDARVSPLPSQKKNKFPFPIPNINFSKK